MLDLTITIKVVAFSLYGPQAASHRVRLSQFQQGLAAQGIELKIQSLLDDDYLQNRFANRFPSLLKLFHAYCKRICALYRATHFDLAIVYGELLPLLPGWMERLLLRIPFICDCDDAFYLKYRQGRLCCMQPFLGAKFDSMIAAAVAVTAGNAELASYARRFNPNVFLLPSVVDTDRYLPSCQVTGDLPFTVGWIGSPSTAPYLHQLVEPLKQLAREQPVRFLVVGGSAPAIPGVEVIECPWTLEQEVSLIQQFAVGVMPLPDSDWARGKSAYKLIQCMACAIPVIASPVGANVDVVPPTCGLLASHADDWLAAFRLLAAQPALRVRLGVASRQWVEDHYSLRITLPVLSSVIRQAVGLGVG